jgi:hypothetical protein
MSLFTIATVEYPVTPPIRVRRQKQDHQRRAFSGKMRSALHHDTNTVARSWDLTLGHLTNAQALTLQGVLTAPGTVSIAGDLIGSAVTVKAIDVRREDGQLTDAVLLSVTFEEVLS